MLYSLAAALVARTASRRRSKRARGTSSSSAFPRERTTSRGLTWSHPPRSRTAAAAGMQPQGVLRVAVAAAAVWVLRGRVLDVLEGVLQALTGQRAKGKLNSFLRGNFAPVREERGPLECEVVEGELPEELDGVFVRTGPNPAVEPTGDAHWFDGDGMLHCMRLKARRAPLYTNRYVQTPRYSLESKAGHPLFTKVGDMVGGFGIARILLGLVRALVRDRGLTPVTSGSTANTALEFHLGSGLLALNEGAAPFALRLDERTGEPATAGEATWRGALTGPFTAHPKVCPSTGEMWTFGYAGRESKALGGALVQVACVDAKGHVTRQIPIHDVTQAVMMHDCALTEKHFILMDHPLVFDPKRMMESVDGLPIAFDETRPSRYGLLSREAVDDSDIVWFALPAHMVFHTLCAWEEGDATTLFACVADRAELADAMAKVQKGQRYAEFYSNPATRPRLSRIRMNRCTGEATVEDVLSRDYIVDFPRTHPARTGRKMQHGYLTRFRQRGGLLVQGCVKVCLSSGTVSGEVAFDKDEHGGEVLFVPRSLDPDAADDDGWLMVRSLSTRSARQQSLCPSLPPLPRPARAHSASAFARRCAYARAR